MIEEWKYEEKKKKKSDAKKEKAVLITLKKMKVGLRIKKRVQEAYDKNGNGHLREKMNLFTNKK